MHTHIHTNWAMPKAGVAFGYMSYIRCVIYLSRQENAAYPLSDSIDMTGGVSDFGCKAAACLAILAILPEFSFCAIPFAEL